MNHTNSTVQVYFTDEYARFKMINGNRMLNEPKIKRIIKEIKDGNDMLRYYPIQVQENKDRLDILDGQHRFFICKKLKLPVFYILVKEQKTMPDIAKINSNVSKWKTEDYINCYVQHENTYYKLLKKFMEDFGMPLSISLLLLSDGHPGVEGTAQGMTEKFQNGTFQVNHMDKAVELAEDCKLFYRFPHWRSRGFVIAIYRIKKAGLITVNELYNAFTKRPEMLTQQANYKSYINTLEQIMNVGKQKRIVII